MCHILGDWLLIYFLCVYCEIGYGYVQCAIWCVSRYDMCHVAYNVRLAMEVFRVPYSVSLAMDMSCAI